MKYYIKIYLVYNNHHIINLKYPIFDDLIKLEASINNDIAKEDSDILIKFVYSDLLINDDNRSQLCTDIFKYLNLKSNDTNCIIKFIIMNSDGDGYKIKNFNLIRGKEDTIYNMGYNKIKNMIDKEQDLSIIAQEYDSKAQISDNIIESIRNSIIAGTILDIMDKEIDKHNISNDIADIKKEELEKENKIIKNEFDMLIANVNEVEKKLSKDHPSIEIESCSYNGKDIEYDDLIEELTTHVLPEYLIPQKNILDTLEDEYIIKSNLFTIIRYNGGNIKVIPNEEYI